ncbi:hypothetical protein GCM10009576_060150 [Streptomyces rhizosphaericus]|uniref:Uncharacterized protein n=1 Tax=Streptomyces rhizosphaericus TaxID=114699 RepID=A0ABN1SG69_9ACTN
MNRAWRPPCADRQIPAASALSADPARTVRTAQAACPKDTPAMLVRDRLDVLFEALGLELDDAGRHSR